METLCQTGAVEEPSRHPCAVVEPADRPADKQECCDHFSLRGYVAQLKKKDPKLCSLDMLRNQQQCDAHHNESSPLSVANYHRWNCSNCLHKVKTSCHRTASETNYVQHDGTNNGCSISIVRSWRKTVDSRSQFSCARGLSPGNDAERSTLLNSAKCSFPSGNKAINAVTVPATLPEENVQDTFVERSVPAAKDFQGSPNNLDVSANIVNDVSMVVSDLPDAPQKISSIGANDTESPCSPKPCAVQNEVENRTAQDVANDDPNESNVGKPISRHKGSKQIFGHRSNLACRQGPRRASLKRNVRSDGKKNNKSADLAGISNLKVRERKPKKMRRLSELICTDQIGGSTDANEVDYANTVDLHVSDRSKMSLEAGKDDDTPVSNQKVGKIQSRTATNKAKHTGVDNADDGSPIVSWRKKIPKKVRTEKKGPGHNNLSSSAVSNSPDIVASNNMHRDVLPSVGELNRKNVLSTTSAEHGNENAQNDNLEQSMQKVNDMCQNQSEDLERRLFSNGNSMILLKRKVLSTATAHGKNIENSTMQRSMLRGRADDLPHIESEGNMQRCPTKVSLGKRKIQNVSGVHKQKKRKPDVYEKQNTIDDIPMDVLELLGRNKHERVLITDTDPLEKSHTRPKIGLDECSKIAAKDCPTDTSTLLDTNVQKSLASEGNQKSLQDQASSSQEGANVHPQDLHTQNSEYQAASSTEPPNGHLPKSHMQNSFQGHELPIARSFNVYSPKLHITDILDCTPEQQTHSPCRNEEVTIACASPIFSHHQHIAEVPAQSWSHMGEKKLMCHSIKTASKNSPKSTYDFQFRNRVQEVDSDPVHVYGASSNYATHQPVIAAIDHYTKEVPNQVQRRSVPTTSLTMEAGGLSDQRITGQSGLYPREPMATTHLPRLMDSSTALGFTDYQRANRCQMELLTKTIGPYVQHDQFNASSSTSYGSHLTERVPLALQDLSWRQVQQNLHRPLRPHPRVGMFGPLLQQDIANWSDNRGMQSGYRLGGSEGTTFGMNRKVNNETLNSGMFSAGWNTSGSVNSVPSPEYPLPRYDIGQPWTGVNGKIVHPLDKLVRKDICETNRNPADFTVISDNNEYMRNV